MAEALRRIVDSPAFHQGITAVIVLAGILAGLETYPAVLAQYGHLLHVIDVIILAIFVGEIALKLGAEGSRPWRYFLDPWNVFDFVIVATALLPTDAEGIAVLRLARLLRVLRLVRALPRLQLLVSALLRSIPSMGYISLLLGLLFYLYAVAATHLFGANDPVHFGTLHISLLTMFRVVTLEGWSELLYIQMRGCDVFGYGDFQALCTEPVVHPVLAPAFFTSFILIGTMVVLNLFVGVIMNGMEEAQEEHAREELARAKHSAPTLASELDELQRKLAELSGQLERVKQLADDKLAAK